MDESTDGVTLYAAFVLDLVAMYAGLSGVAAPLQQMAAGLDPNQPRALVPIALYNRTCAWIEQTFGEAGIRDAGKRIGERSYRNILDRTGKPKLTPLEILRELQRSARISIQDTSGRGWEFLSEAKGRVVMRRTQTFHCLLQETLLLALVDKTGVERARVTQNTCTRRGDEFCDYVITWNEKH